MQSRQGNVHPAVAGRMGAGTGVNSALNHTSPGLNTSAGGGGGMSASRGGVNGSNVGINASAQLSVDEAEARSRAREILNDFVQQKMRASELESQLQRSLQENERVSHVMQERRAEAAVERERLGRELESVKRANTEAETRVAASRDEVRKVAQSCAQRAADTSAHLRLKEQETQQLETELLKSRDECRQLRAELLRLQSAGSSVDDVERAQQRMVDLAKKLLESEKAKSQLEDSIKDDRRHQQQALRTIESMRKQVAEGEQRLRDSESSSQSERESHERAIAALHREMDSQRAMYREFVERIGNAGSGPTQRALEQANAAHSTQLQLVQVQLESSKEVALRVAQQLENANADAERLRKDLSHTKHSHVHDVTELQKQLHAAEHALLVERQATAERKAAQQSDREAVEQLKAVHENLKVEYSSVVKHLSTVEATMEQCAKQHEELDRQQSRLKEEAEAREAVERHVADVLENRRALEQKLREAGHAHDHEIQMMRMQIAHAVSGGSGGGGVNGSAALVAGFQSAPAKELEKDLATAKERIHELELERDRLEAERRAVNRNLDDDRRSHRSELDAVKRQLEEARVGLGEANAAATAARREREEWASAFAYSERTRAKLQGRIDDLEAERHDLSRDRSSNDTRLTMLQSASHRLEQQADRDAQEIFRLRRSIASLEVDLAKRDSEIKRLEILRLEAQSSAALQLAGVTGAPVGLSASRVDKDLQEKREQLDERMLSLERKRAAATAYDAPTPMTRSSRHDDHKSPSPVAATDAAVPAPPLAAVDISIVPDVQADHSIVTPPLKGGSLPTPQHQYEGRLAPFAAAASAESPGAAVAFVPAAESLHDMSIDGTTPRAAP